MSTQTFRQTNSEPQTGTSITEGGIWTNEEERMRVIVDSVNNNSIDATVVFKHDYSPRPGDSITIPLKNLKSDSWKCMC